MSRTLSTAIVLCTFAAAGCGSGKKAASCDARGTPLDDGSLICLEHQSSDLKLPRTACDFMGGAWSVGELCGALAESLGGCKLKEGAMWFFPSEKHKNADDVRAQCAQMGKGTVLPYLDPIL